MMFNDGILKEIFFSLILLTLLTSFACAEEKITHRINGNVEVWRIDQPNVQQPETDYPLIKFRIGDVVSFKAGGIVNTGGWGLHASVM